MLFPHHNVYTKWTWCYSSGCWMADLFISVIRHTWQVVHSWVIMLLGVLGDTRSKGWVTLTTWEEPYNPLKMGCLECVMPAAWSHESHKVCVRALRKGWIVWSPCLASCMEAESTKLHRTEPTSSRSCFLLPCTLQTQIYLVLLFHLQVSLYCTRQLVTIEDRQSKQNHTIR